MDAPKKLCGKPNCGGRVSKGICDRCGIIKLQTNKVYDNSRGTAHERGYDSRWKKIRDKKLRADPLCVMCRAMNKTTLASEVDHIIPLANGGTNKESNLQGLCHSCHVIKTFQDKKLYLSTF